MDVGSENEKMHVIGSVKCSMTRFGNGSLENLGSIISVSCAG
jgi:hypothetical protein